MDNPLKKTAYPRVHIKIADRGWILEKCASEIAKRADWVTYGTDADSSADIQYYVNYSARRERVSPIEIAFFTHSERDANARSRYFGIANEVDHCICMSQRYVDELAEQGVAGATLIVPGVELGDFVPKVRIGVVGRTYHTGRKGEALVAAVMDVPGIEWRFTGSGWPGPSVHVPEDGMADFYNDLDYVLVPALYEGGPMSVLEAIACGVPVISSDVGWVNEYPHIPFENGNPNSLREVLERLVAERFCLRKPVLERTWEAWAVQHLELFQRLAEVELPVYDIDAVPEVEPGSLSPQYSIVSHGTEKSTKGGPTSRIANIVAAAESMGERIDVCPGLAHAEPGGQRGVYHVFNSWPLNSALNELRLARKSGRKVVYSPIALNLSPLHYYQQALPQLLREAVSSDQVKVGVESIRQLTRPFDPDSTGRPPQGVKGHHDALREGIDLADEVILLSEYERGFLRSVGADVEHATIVRNGVDASDMAAGDADLFRNAYGISDFVLFVGRIEPRKNQALAAFALRDLNIPFVCIGHVGDAEYFELLKKWAGPSFVHIERIDDRSLMASAYKSARCVVLNSWAEGAPLSALEAAAAGTPLILSNMAAECEYFGDYAKYVHPCDLAGLRDAVDELLKNPESKEERANRSQFALSNFGIERHTAETLAVYRAALRDRDVPDAPPAAPVIALDVTHLGHQMVNSGILTGVTAVEYSLARAVVKALPSAPVFVWNSSDRLFVQTDLESILDRDGAKQVCTMSQPITAGGAMQIASVSMSIPQPGAPVSPLTWRRVCISLAKEGIARLPEGIRRLIVKAIKLVRPQFTVEILPEHRVLHRVPPTPFDPSEAQRVHVRVAMKQVQEERGGAALPPHSRVLLLGQPWISNDRMLEDLERFVRRYDLSLWAHVPDILYVTDAETFDDDTRRVYRRRVEKLLSFCDSAIVISEHAEREIRGLIRQSGFQAKTRRVHLGISEELRSATPKRPERRMPARFVLYVSSMNNRKRHNFVTDAWKDARKNLRGAADDVGLIYVGGAQMGYEKYGQPAFQAELEKDGIFVMSGINAEELSWLYRNCLFTVYPPRAEGWGLPPIESLAFGKPCIVSSVIPSAVETVCSALVKVAPNDYFGWVDAIRMLLGSEGVLASLSERAMQFTAPSWDDAAKELIDLR